MDAKNFCVKFRFYESETIHFRQEKIFLPRKNFLPASVHQTRAGRKYSCYLTVTLALVQAAG
jgi:hypothetical protein